MYGLRLFEEALNKGGRPLYRHSYDCLLMYINYSIKLIHTSCIMKFIHLFLFVCFLSAISEGCSSPESTAVCTDIFQMYDVTALNPDGTPADSVNITVKNQKTGRPYDICSDISCSDGEDGTYLIMHDGLDAQLSSEGTAVLVEGVKGSLHFRADYIFRSGVCHVRKVAGPDTVSLSMK